MKIASANLQMASTHAVSQQYESSATLRLSIDRDPAALPGGGKGTAASPPSSPVQISEAGKAAQSKEARGIEDGLEAVDHDPKLLLIMTMLEFMTGEKVRVFDGHDLQLDSQGSDIPASDPSAPAKPEAAADQPPPSAGFGLAYDYRESYSESEQTSFSAQGVVHTADGQEISFKLDLDMERGYHEENQASLRLGDAARKQDPLVLNFAGTAAQLTDTRFSFDLEGKGQASQVNFVRPGSGFLALDRNHDGRINNGSELFGPTSGDGFGELARLDDDRNGWIDENDAAYRDLRLWTRDAAGNDSLQSLADAGVGALALAHIATPFDIRDGKQQTLGQVRSSGVFLQGNAKIGTIQQVDLTI